MLTTVGVVVGARGLGGWGEGGHSSLQQRLQCGALRSDSLSLHLGTLESSRVSQGQVMCFPVMISHINTEKDV